ncbi:MAG: hypothetical protein O9346_17595 [Leptospiraceae bacterium]|nr:hypothetical protein [Leptospiraceae bacterium]
MFCENFNDELASSYTNNSDSHISIEGKTILPKLGLKAGTLLDTKQMKKLHEIRNRHLKSEQILSFMKD